ncbi:uncharacterized protein WCC33_011544 [Rhinophrynus dorsalis]
MEQKQISGSQWKPVSRKRKERFSDPELHTLVDEIMVHADELFGPKSSNVLRKTVIWETVANKVNNIGGLKREVEECKKRWSDYKRKVKRNVSELKASVPLETTLPRRQELVARFFKMDADDKNEIQGLSDDANLNQVQVSQQSSLSLNIDSDCFDDDFEPDSKKGLVFFTNSSSENDPQDKSISQSNRECQSSKHPSGYHKADALNTLRKHTPALPSQQTGRLDTKLDKLIVRQKDTNDILQTIQSDVRKSLVLQRKTNRLLKNNFIEIKKSFMSVQKMSRDHENHLDVSLKRLQTSLDELNNNLQVKNLQELMASDDSDQDWNSGQRITSTLMSKEKGHASSKRVEGQYPSKMFLTKKNNISK